MAYILKLSLDWMLESKGISIQEGFSIDPILSIVCGVYGFCLAISEEGHVFGWGYNKNGELGLGDNEYRDSPTPLKAILSSILYFFDLHFCADIEGKRHQENFCVRF
jgi:hypothetical protein